jgi:hypoxanthine phosphoribosyltransferase
MIQDHQCAKCGADRFTDCSNDLLIQNVLYSGEDIHEAVKRLAVRISSDYANKQPLVLLCILKGAYMFTADLSRAITIPHTVEFIRAENYSGIESTEDNKMIEEFAPPTDKHVIIVEDIVDTGITLSRIMQEVWCSRPLSIERCALIRKQAKATFYTKYIGLDSDLHEGEFAIGYGLNFDQGLQRLPFIATASIRDRV